jgi:hypothetical protein
MRVDVNKKVRTVIVDDESIARKRISSLLSEHASFRLVGEYENGVDAPVAMLKDPSISPTNWILCFGTIGSVGQFFKVCHKIGIWAECESLVDMIKTHIIIWIFLKYLTFKLLRRLLISISIP